MSYNFPKLTTWNSNTIRAGKRLALTIGAFVLCFVTSELQEYMLALSAALAFITTYYGIAAIRCKHAQKQDVWAGIGITLIAGAVGCFSIVRLVN